MKASNIFLFTDLYTMANVMNIVGLILAVTAWASLDGKSMLHSSIPPPAHSGSLFGFWGEGDHVDFDL